MKVVANPIPHPFVIESLAKFEPLPESEKRKIVFIHFNHTNSVENPESEASKRVVENGFRVGRMGRFLGCEDELKFQSFEVIFMV